MIIRFSNIFEDYLNYKNTNYSIFLDNYKLFIDMKFIASSSLLLKELQMIGGIINNTTTLPILENFMFDINNDKLTLTASDLETTFSTQLNIESEDNGRIALPAKLLLDTLKTFPDQPLTFLKKLKKIQLKLVLIVVNILLHMLMEVNSH